MRATPCCHAHAVASRYLAICQCSARLGHRAALLPLRRAARLNAPPSLPPSLLSTLTQRRSNTPQWERGRPTASFIVTEAHFSARTPVFLNDLSRRCVQIIRFLRAASLRSRSARRRIGPLASPRRSVHSLKAG